MNKSCYFYMFSVKIQVEHKETLDEMPFKEKNQVILKVMQYH